MNSFNEFRHVNAPGHCIWCGKKLRKKWRMEHAPYVTTWHPPDPPHYPVGYAVGSGRLVNVGEPMLGDYGDGHFCGLRCGYRFGVRLAQLGSRLQPVKARHVDEKGPAS